MQSSNTLRQPDPIPQAFTLTTSQQELERQYKAACSLLQKAGFKGAEFKRFWVAEERDRIGYISLEEEDSTYV